MEGDNNGGLLCCLKPYLQGTIFPQMVVGYNDRINRVLLEEFKELTR